MSDMVESPEERFSGVAAPILLMIINGNKISQYANKTLQSHYIATVEEEVTNLPTLLTISFHLETFFSSFYYSCFQVHYENMPM